MSAIFREEWLEYAEEWGSECKGSTNGASRVCLCLPAHVCAQPWSTDYGFFFFEMTELLAHLDGWVQSSGCFVASRTISGANTKKLKQFYTKLYVDGQPDSQAKCKKTEYKL